MLAVVDRADVIPLFPLPLVVLPGEIVPLHVFEERYKAMIADCRAGSGPARPFGIALARGKEVHAAGCTVSIVEVMREYEDGRLDIVTVGQTRFRVRELFRDRPYHTAEVEYFGDRDEPVDAALRRRAIDALTGSAGRPRCRAPGPRSPGSASLPSGSAPARSSTRSRSSTSSS